MTDNRDDRLALGDEATGPVTEQHLAYVRATCRRMSGTAPGMVDYDEIYSQALVTLWELVLSFDSDRQIPFGAYLSINLRRRLIDWLRQTYGRTDRPHVRSALQQTVSLDAIVEHIADPFPSSAPSVEEQVMDRETLDEVLDRVRDTLTNRQAMALLEPVISDENRDDFWDRAGTNRATQFAHRVHARRRVAALVEEDIYTPRQAPRFPGQRKPSD